MIPNKFVTIFICVFLTAGTIYVGLLSGNAHKTYGYIDESMDRNNVISIDGEGKAVGIPDVAKMRLGYSVEKKTIIEAQKENVNKINIIIDKLKKEFKIDPQDIKTINYVVSPQYEYSPSGKQSLRGYLVSQDLNVKVREMDKISQILDVASAVGINQVGNLSFEIDNLEKLKDEARIKALEQAKKKADSITKTMNIRLGKITSFYETVNNVGAPFEGFNGFGGPTIGLASELESVSKKSNVSGQEKIATNNADAVSLINIGSNEIVITVTVSYQIL